MSKSIKFKLNLTNNSFFDSSKLNKKTVLFFYPKAMTSGCTIEVCDFQANYDKFKKIGFNLIGVSKDPVENNIKFAKFDASDQEIKEACQLAAADEFIETLPEKYQTNIGENGIRLSGGQKQRLSIARAILKNSPIILLDEATSSLDTESEEKVQNAIFNLTKNKTTLVIAHRLSTIKKADSIVVMKDGNIVGAGKHEDLLVKSKDYENLYSKQVI